MNSPDLLELQVMAHRYLYYVLSESVISDSVYDQIENAARSVCKSDSPVHGVGSSLAGSYSNEQIEYANKLLGNV